MVLCRFAAILLAALVVTAASGHADESLEITAKRVRLNDEDWSQSRIGQLRWRGGLALQGDHYGFGGLSGLIVSPDGARLIAVTDKGRWITARLLYRDGRPAALVEARIGHLRDPRGGIYRRKVDQDAEALALTGRGALLIAFEHDHRIDRYRNLSAAAEPLDGPAGLIRLEKNGGIEALVSLADGRILAVAEQPIAEDLPRHHAFLRAAGQWRELEIETAPGYWPVGAARLPDGDVLLLTRRYSVLGGLKARIERLAAADLRPGALVRGAEVAAFAPPLTLDNFEAISVFRGPEGETLVALLSDDNFQPLQRTLLLIFALEE